MARHCSEPTRDREQEKDGMSGHILWTLKYWNSLNFIDFRFEFTRIVRTLDMWSVCKTCTKKSHMAERFALRLNVVTIHSTYTCWIIEFHIWAYNESSTSHFSNWSCEYKFTISSILHSRSFYSVRSPHITDAELRTAICRFWRAAYYEQTIINIHRSTHHKNDRFIRLGVRVVDSHVCM